MSLANVTFVGILNVTPDSFYDGGQNDSVEKALERVGQLLADGADIIDIGGESTGPGSEDVTEQEELNRVLPVVEAIIEKHPDAVLSIDTSKSTVAKASVDAGVSLVNDVTAGRGDPAMLEVVAALGVPLVLMYAKDSSSRTTTEAREYDDVLATVKQFLEERKDAALQAGVLQENIILDPGLGFFVSGEAGYSLEILSRLSELQPLGCPLYVSPSRKSFIAGSEKLPPEDRLPGTIVASAIAAVNGAQYIRTHDVTEVRRGVEIATAIEERKNR